MNMNQTKSAVEEPSNPYYLHHSDSPGLVLVSQQFSGDNYVSWSRAMRIALSAKNKLGFIDGTIPKPEGTDSDILNSWIRNNNTVISWILNSVSKDISASIIFSETAYEIWEDLKERFQQRNGPRIFHLRQELMNLHQGQDSVSIYFTKLKTIWEELGNYRPTCTCGNCSCGGVKSLNLHYQMEYIMSFLMGLHESFSQIRGQLLLMDPLPPINRVFALITQEEHQRKISNALPLTTENTGNMAFAAKIESAKPHNTGQNSFGGNKRHKKDRPFCTHCKINGHTVDNCFKIHGYPPSSKSKSREHSSSNVHQVTVSEPDQNGSFGGFVQSLNPNQYQQLMSMFSTHLAGSTKAVIDQNVNVDPTGFTFTEVSSVRASKRKVICCHFSSDGKLLASGGRDTKAVLWHTDTLKPKATLEEHSMLITDVRFSPSMPRLATSSFDRTVRVWDANNPGFSLCTFTGHSASVMSLDFHPNKEDIICSCDGDGEIRYWSINNGSCARVFKGGTGQMRFQPCLGRYLAAAAENVVSILDVETQACRHSLLGHTKPIRSVCWDPSGEFLASVSEDSVRVWTLGSGNEGECIHELSCIGNKFHSCVFHPTYSSLLVIGCYQSLELWNMSENKTMTLSAHDGLIASLAVSTVSGLVASASHDKIVKLWK